MQKKKRFGRLGAETRSNRLADHAKGSSLLRGPRVGPALGCFGRQLAETLLSAHRVPKYEFRPATGRRRNRFTIFSFRMIYSELRLKKQY